MTPATSSGGLQIDPNLSNEKLHPQAAHNERKSPAVSTTFKPNVGLHGSYHDILNSSSNFDKRSDLPESTSKLKRHHFDFEQLDTDDEATKRIQQPTALQHIGPTSLALHPQRLNASSRPDSSECTAKETRSEQLNFNLNIEERLEQQHGHSCKSEEVLGLQNDIIPNFGHHTDLDDEPAHPRPLPGSSRGFKLDAGDSAELPSHPDTMYESLICSNLVNVEAIQKAPTKSKASYRKAARSEPGVSSRDRRHRSAKARAQYLRDHCCRSASVPTEDLTVARRSSFPFLKGSEELRPKHKHCAFVQEQELKCLFEDRVGTPHLSELQPGDGVNSQLNVDELSVGGEVAALSIEDGATQRPSTFVLTDDPNEELGFS